MAHLDPARRVSLFDALDGIGAQGWTTGADPATFADVAQRADMFDVRGLLSDVPAAMR